MRFFTVSGSGTNFEGGRYAAKDNVIGTAARKAGARLYRNLTDSQIKAREKNNIDGIKFILRETTRGSKKSTYHFIVKKEVLSKPVLIKKKGGAADAAKQNQALKDELMMKKKGAPKSEAKVFDDLVEIVGALKEDEVGYVIYNRYAVKSAKSPSEVQVTAKTPKAKKSATVIKATAVKGAKSTSQKTASKDKPKK